MRSIRKVLQKLPKRFQWTLHNVVGHPVSEVLYQLGFEKLSAKVHDHTAPFNEAVSPVTPPPIQETKPTSAKWAVNAMKSRPVKVTPPPRPIERRRDPDEYPADPPLLWAVGLNDFFGRVFGRVPRLAQAGP